MACLQLTFPRRGWSSRLQTFHPNENGEDFHRLLAGIVTVMRLVGGFGEALALAIGSLAACPIVNGQLAFEDKSEERNEVRVPPGLLPWLQDDLQRCKQSWRPKWIVNWLAGNGSVGR